MAHPIDDHSHRSDVDYTEFNSTPYLLSDSIGDQASSMGELMSTSDDLLDILNKELAASYGQVGDASSQDLTSAINTFGGYDDLYPINFTVQGVGTGIPAKREPPDLDCSIGSKRVIGLQGDSSMNALLPGSVTLSVYPDSTAMTYGQDNVNDSITSSSNSDQSPMA
jgi:hypothetical protein